MIWYRFLMKFPLYFKLPRYRPISSGQFWRQRSVENVKVISRFVFHRFFDVDRLPVSAGPADCACWLCLLHAAAAAADDDDYGDDDDDARWWRYNDDDVDDDDDELKNSNGNGLSTISSWFMLYSSICILSFVLSLFIPMIEHNNSPSYSSVRFLYNKEDDFQHTFLLNWWNKHWQSWSCW